MIYLDNAATSFPKPHRVIREVRRCLTTYCGNPGRGAHALALASAERIYACREALADFLGLGAPERILFTYNTTHALNLVLKGFLKRGDHVLISELEHNAVRRPLCRLREEGVITFDTFPVVGKSHEELLAGVAERVRPSTVAIVCTHASNICSLTLPIEKLGAYCHSHGLRFIVDAAQSAGHMPIDMQRMHIDALAAPGHKALYGIQGAGILALCEGFELCPLMEGGSGVDSLSEQMPQLPPERYEAGTLATPAIAALLAGVEFVKKRGLDAIAEHEAMLYRAARERLESLPGLRVHLPEQEGAVLLFSHERLCATELGQRLSKAGICVRAGYHCAPLAHRALGTPDGGAVRVGFGVFNALSDVDALWRALKQQ